MARDPLLDDLLAVGVRAARKGLAGLLGSLLQDVGAVTEEADRRVKRARQRCKELDPDE